MPEIRTAMAELLARSSEDASTLAERLCHLAETDPEMVTHLITYGPGDVLLTEGTPNDTLFVILEGDVTLYKASDDGSPPLQLSTLVAGDLLGVNSVVSRHLSFSTGRANGFLRCLELDGPTLDSLPAIHPEFHRLLQYLTTATLAARSRSSVHLQLRLAAANQELTETRNQLVHQEKMAVLGQLSAGLAHELNNPAAALIRQRDHLETAIEEWLTAGNDAGDRDFWDAGLRAVSIGSPEARAQAQLLETAHPQLPRALLRRLAAMPADLWPRILAAATASALLPGGDRRLAIFETSLLLQSQFVAATQICHLVAGLKNYAHPSNDKPAPVNLGESINQVLVILAHLLKHVPLETEIDASLEVLGRGGDLNQVWTNLIRNAHAAEPGSPIRVVAERVTATLAVVRIIDHGPGVPDSLRERVFDLNFTSKTGKENFGLGLGLPISQGIILTHGGRIEISKTPGGGATFSVYLPTA